VDVHARHEARVQPGLRLPRWLALVAGLAGSLVGFAANLYSTEFRQAITASSRWLSGTVLSVILVAVVSSGSAIVVYRLLIRREVAPEMSVREIHIGADALERVTCDQDAVVGRSLRYLEVARDSAELVVFLHGLGLDADDFQPYLVESKFHCVALTLFGFNASEREDDYYQPISLSAQLQLLGYALGRIRRDNPRKKITLVGFSFGADALLLVNELASEAVTDLDVSRAVLLDPNVNRTTTTISSKVAAVSAADPLPELLELLHSARDINELGYLCAYLRKITSKDFGQVSRHAREVVERWEEEGYQTFLDRVGLLAHKVDDVHIILSFGFEKQFFEMARAARGRGLDIDNLDCSRSGHFDLIASRFLRDRLEGLLDAP
jgi:pimeloyl-ACP methyl ester carboxylesterase